MEFEDYLRKNYHLGDKSVKDYISRWNGILNKGLYNGETEWYVNTKLDNFFKVFKFSVDIPQFISFKDRGPLIGLGYLSGTIGILLIIFFPLF